MSGEKGTCRIEGCDRPVRYKELCKLHVTRMERHGDPLAFIPHSERNFPRGSANVRWSGDQASYSGMHQRVRYTRGAARNYLCAECGSQAAQWSYDHADPDERQSEFGAYSVNIDHYVPRCVPCHKAFDLSLIAPKPEAPVDPEVVRRLRGDGISIGSVAKLLGVPYRRIQRALDEMELPRTVRKGIAPQPRCDQPMRPWRGVINLCSKPRGHEGKHEARRRPKGSPLPETGEAS